ncbi:MAG: membrane protein insertion efficiency factor YidD [Nitriliruptorales bacterium]
MREHHSTETRPTLLARILSLPVLLWRATAPMRTPRCRFYPSCSTYALEALRTHGAFRGTWLSVRRVLSCHPWNPGGVDHVPATRGASREDRR